MMHCKLNRFFKRILPLGFVLASLASCSDYNMDFGLDFLPSDQVTTLNSVTLTASGIDGYLVQETCLPSACLGIAMLGNYTDDSYGTVSASSYIQFTPDFLYDDDIDDDLSDYTAQSISIYLPFSQMLINDGVSEDAIQTFYIYEAYNTIDSDSIYYSNFNPIYDPNDNPSGVIEDAQKPLFYFQIKANQSNEYIDLFPYNNDYSDEGAYREFLDRLLAADTSTYDTEEEFLEEFDGFFISSWDYYTEYSDGSFNDEVTMIFSTDLAYANLRLYIADETSTYDEDSDEYEDDMYLYYYFTDTSDYYNLSLNIISHSYDGTSLDGKVYVYPYEYSDYYYEEDDWNYNEYEGVSAPDASSLISDDIARIQTLGGVTTMLHFSDDFVDALNKLYTLDDVEYGNLVINEATITFTVENLDTSTIVDRLGMFYDYQNSINAPDYRYSSEQDGYTIDWGGYYNYARNQYTMDITDYIQRLALSKKGTINGIDYSITPRYVNMTPDISKTFTFGQVELDFDPANVEIKLLYTLVP